MSADDSKDVYLSVDINGDQFEINAKIEWAVQKVLKGFVRNQYFGQGAKMDDILITYQGEQINKKMKICQIGQRFKLTKIQDLKLKLMNRKKIKQQKDKIQVLGAFRKSILIDDEVIWIDDQRQQRRQQNIQDRRQQERQDERNIKQDKSIFEKTFEQSTGNFSVESILKSIQFNSGQFKLSDFKPDMKKKFEFDIESLRKKLTEMYTAINDFIKDSHSNLEEFTICMTDPVHNLRNLFDFIRQQINSRDNKISELEKKNKQYVHAIKICQEQINQIKKSDASIKKIHDSLSALLQKNSIVKTLVLGQQSCLPIQQNLFRKIKNSIQAQISHFKSLVSLQISTINMGTILNLFENYLDKPNILVTLQFSDKKITEQLAIFSQRGISRKKISHLQQKYQEKKNQFWVYDLNNEKQYSDRSVNRIYLNAHSIDLFGHILVAETSKQFKTSIRINHQKIQNDPNNFWKEKTQQRGQLKSIEVFQTFFKSRIKE